MKKYILFLFPFFTLNAQVTIGPESDDQPSAMLNITVPGSVFIMPVGDKDQVTALSRSFQTDENSDPLEGSMIFHSKSNLTSLEPTDRDDDSGIYLRIKSSNQARSSVNNSYEWKPFKVRNRTYIYNNIQSEFNEQLLGYSPKSGGLRLNTTNCFKWDRDLDVNGNNHLYCLENNRKQNRSYTMDQDPRLDADVCFKKDWACAFAIALLDDGYIATITSQEELNFIDTNLKRILGNETPKIAIGLRRVNNNEGDRTSYNNGSLVKKLTWVNGESNKVGWLSSSNSNITNNNVDLTTSSSNYNCGIIRRANNNSSTKHAVELVDCNTDDFNKVLVEYNF